MIFTFSTLYMTLHITARLIYIKNTVDKPIQPKLFWSIITIHCSPHIPYIICRSPRKQRASMTQCFGPLLPELHFPSRPRPNSTFSLCPSSSLLSHPPPNLWKTDWFLPCAPSTHYSWYWIVNHHIIWCDCCCKQSPPLYYEIFICVWNARTQCIAWHTTYSQYMLLN